MRSTRIAQATLVLATLAVLGGCGDDEDGVAPLPTATGATRTATLAASTSTRTPSASPTSPPPSTNTPLLPTRTPTDMPPPTATGTHGDPAATPTATEASVDTPTSTPTPQPETPTESPTQSSGLGVREVSVIRPGSAFYTSALGGFDVSIDPWLPGTLKLEAGMPDGSGVAPLALVEDVVLGWPVIDFSVACMKFFAAGSAGTVSCNGGVPQGILVSQNSNGDQSPGPLVILTGQGDSSPAGSASLTLTRAVVNLPTGSSVSACNTAEYGAPEAAAFTTAIGGGLIENPVQGGNNIQISKEGEPFDCAAWTNPAGPGQLVNPVIGLDIEPVGDVVNILFVSGHAVE